VIVQWIVTWLPAHALQDALVGRRALAALSCSGLQPIDGDHDIHRSKTRPLGRDAAECAGHHLGVDARASTQAESAPAPIAHQRVGDQRYMQRLITRPPAPERARTSSSPRKSESWRSCCVPPRCASTKCRSIQGSAAGTLRDLDGKERTPAGKECPARVKYFRCFIVAFCRTGKCEADDEPVRDSRAGFA